MFFDTNIFPGFVWEKVFEMMSLTYSSKMLDSAFCFFLFTDHIITKRTPKYEFKTCIVQYYENGHVTTKSLI